MSGHMSVRALDPGTSGPPLRNCTTTAVPALLSCCSSLNGTVQPLPGGSKAYPFGNNIPPAVINSTCIFVGTSDAHYPNGTLERDPGWLQCFTTYVQRIENTTGIQPGQAPLASICFEYVTPASSSTSPNSSTSGASSSPSASQSHKSGAQEQRRSWRWSLIGIGIIGGLLQVAFGS